MMDKDSEMRVCHFGIRALGSGFGGVGVDGRCGDVHLRVCGLGCRI